MHTKVSALVSPSSVVKEREKEEGVEWRRADLLLRIPTRNSDLACRLLKARRAEDFLRDQG